MINKLHFKKIVGLIFIVTPSGLNKLTKNSNGLFNSVTSFKNYLVA